MSETDDGPGMSPAPTTSTESRADRPRRSQPAMPPRRSGETPMRLPFVQTNGKNAYLYDADIATVVSVSTEKNGACLILRVRGGEDVWIKDNDRHRWLLSMADNVETAEHLARAGRPRR